MSGKTSNNRVKSLQAWAIRMANDVIKSVAGDHFYHYNVKTREISAPDLPTLVEVTIAGPLNNSKDEIWSMSFDFYRNEGCPWRRAGGFTFVTSNQGAFHWIVELDYGIDAIVKTEKVTQYFGQCRIVRGRMCLLSWLRAPTEMGSI